ncbi:hypothetical protein ABT337_08985 [Saccharopolyspora hirsuta]|uniref:DUF2867 domain-containing protein n=1 Tax=Saccharopolyspora hirsuta TaxID=1837 RepID=A0A5M7BB24_SACHI|nr:hypothetical protein [Saccharopolyspora hirsuta]KAA5826836.1 hypothetical protein F1721_30525 [Saccharopolyspora hirsuta]
MTNVRSRPGVAAIPAPDDVRSFSSLRRIDYEDAFAVGIAEHVSGSAEQWARAVFESAPAPLRAFLRFGWSMLGAKLGPASSAEHVFGLRIGAAQPDRIRLEVLWRIGLRANLMFRMRSHSLVFATFVEHRRRASRFIWPLVVPIHVVVMRYLLTRAAAVEPRAR